MEHCFSIVRGLQARFDEVFYLSVRYYTSVRLGHWVVARLGVIFGGHSLDFFRNTGYVEIIMEQVVAGVPGCIYYSSEKFRLESLNYF
jgi:hypothetical protein